MTDTPIYQEAWQAHLRRLARPAIEHAMIDAPLPHDEPNLARLNRTINTRWEKQCP